MRRGPDLSQVIWLVGAVLVLSVAGIIALASGLGQGRPIPDVLQNIAVGSLTALVGLLVPTRREGG